MVITPVSVVWVRRMTRRARNLTGAQCTGERRPNSLVADMTLTLPNYCQGEILGVIALCANGADVENAASAQLLEILRYSLAKTPWAQGTGTGRLD